MADERYILIRPPQLPELAEVGAGAYVVGYDSATDRTVKINVSALGGAEQVTDLIWRSNVEYELNEIKEYGLKLWKSKIAGNQGNIPAENQYWTEVSKAGEGGGITNYATGVYTYTPTIVLRFEKLYRLAATLPFESTDFDAELEIGRWRLLNDSKIIGVAYGVGMTGNYTFVNLDDTLIVLNSGSVNSLKEGASPLTISLSEPSYIVKTGAGNTLSDFTILPIFGGGGSGHVIQNAAGTDMPTQPALQFGAGFTVADETGKTVVGNTAARRIGALSVETNNVEIDFAFLNDFVASNRVSISANATISFTNATNAQFATFKAAITNLATITFPINSISGDDRIISRVFTPTENGNYSFSIYLTENDYEIVISQNPSL